MPEIINEEGEVIAHYGVKGMQWGVRKARDRFDKWNHQTERKLNRKLNRVLLGKKKGDKVSDAQDAKKARYIDPETGKKTQRAKDLGKKQVKAAVAGALVGLAFNTAMAAIGGGTGFGGAVQGALAAGGLAATVVTYQDVKSKK